MPKFKPCNYDQMVTLAPAASAGVLPISLQNQILPGSLEHTIHEVVEKHMDLSVFDQRYNKDDTGATAIASTTSTTPTRKTAPPVLCAMAEQPHRLLPLSLRASARSPAERARCDESQNGQSRRQKDLRPPVSDCRASG